MTNEQQPAEQDSIDGPCETCGDRGWIGGPSYREPDEGGVQCPDCNVIDQHTKPADQGRGVGVKRYDLAYSEFGACIREKENGTYIKLADHEAAIAALTQPKPLCDYEATHPMTDARAVYFLQRFKRDEKMLGPNEQLALDYCIAALSLPRQSEAVAYRWHRNGEPVDYWTDGQPSDRQIQAALACAGLANWTLELAYAPQSVSTTPPAAQGDADLVDRIALILSGNALYPSGRTIERAKAIAALMHGTPQPAQADTTAGAHGVGDAAKLYDAAAKGFHTSQSYGPDKQYLHVIKFSSLESLHAYEDAWTKVMVSERDSR